MKRDTMKQPPHIIVLSPEALPLAAQIKQTVSGQIAGFLPRLAPLKGQLDDHFEDVKDYCQMLFNQQTPIVAIMASGAVIRLLAPLLENKKAEPPVLAISFDGQSIVPLLGGHQGANDLARHIAEGLGTRAAITTAGDVCFGVALDAPPEGFHMANSENAKAVMAVLLSGEAIRLNASMPELPAWLKESNLPFSPEGKVKLTVTEKDYAPQPLELIYHPQSLVLGMGAVRGACGDEAIQLAEQVLAQSGLSVRSLAMVASIDLKQDEQAIHAVADHFQVPARFFSNSELQLFTDQLQNPSEIVFQEVGCLGVAEGAALAGASMWQEYVVQKSGELIVAKTKSDEVTAALARMNHGSLGKLTGKPQGRLFVVGIGPGKAGWRSPEVTEMLQRATELVGYSLYLDLLGNLAENKTRHDFALGKEEDRVRFAMELAGEGKDVALVCSGDAGIYAMATLVFELMEKGDISTGAKGIDIAVSPGISAMQAASSLAGAPLGHDFCAISLSDLLTPWDVIKQRLEGAALGDFVIAFYNPVSKRRRSQLAYARDLLLQHRPNKTPVILASNLGREDEQVKHITLSELNIDDVDMLTLVLVGSSETRQVKARNGKMWIYTPRGYASNSKAAEGSSSDNEMFGKATGETLPAIGQEAEQ